MVVDTSALLALLLGEPAAAWVAEQLQGHSTDLLMSTVNLTETLIRLHDLRPAAFDSVERRLVRGDIRYVPPTIEHAQIAAAARLRFPLNLGDCFAYALAVAEGVPILTLDRDFRGVDCQVITLPPRF